MASGWVRCKAIGNWVYLWVLANGVGGNNGVLALNLDDGIEARCREKCIQSLFHVGKTIEKSDVHMNSMRDVLP